MQHKDDASGAPDSYASAAGWQPAEPDPHQKRLEKYRRDNPLLFATDSMIESRPAAAWLTNTDKRRPTKYLFGDAWLEGELAVLVGDKGAGKSILAIQIAESIVRGHAIEPFRYPRTAVRDQKVIYFDLEQTDARFTERYTAPSKVRGKPPVKHTFPKNVIRAVITPPADVPRPFRNDLNKFLIYSIEQEIIRTGAKVAIIDSLSYLSAGTAKDATGVRLLKNIKYWTTTLGISVLVLIHSRHKKGSPPYRGGVAARPGRADGVVFPTQHPLSITDLPAGIVQLADTIFALGHSTFGPEVRYLKLLDSTRSPSPGICFNTEQRVLSYLIERTPGTTARPDRTRRDRRRPACPRAATENTEAAGTRAPLPARAATENTEDTETRLTTTANCPPTIANCFLALTYLGGTTEENHLIDHTAERLEFERRARIRDLAVSGMPVSQIQQIVGPDRALQKRRTIVDDLLSPAYTRYLKS